MTEISYSIDREVTFADHPLMECDPSAFARLGVEVQQSRERGYDVTIGYTPDRAYDDPAAIVDMYGYLYARDVLLAEERQRIIAEGVGSVGVNPLKRAYRREKRIYDRLEPLRDQLLFGQTESDSQAWHRQRGRAAALLTIAAAHDLRAGGDERYQTMSGPLSSDVLDFHFPTTGTAFDGLSLHDAVVKTESEYSGKDRAVAEAIAGQRIAELQAFVDAPVSPKFKEIVQYCSDSLGIRSRKQEVNATITQHIEQLALSGRTVGDVLMMSYGCGTALPMLEALQQLRDQVGAAPKLILIDQDPLALAAAATLAKQMDLSDNIEIHCRQLFDKLFRPIDIDSVLAGRMLDISEDSGLREYLPDGVYKRLTAMTWRHLKDGGLMSTGNMNANRPQAEFLHGMMGWQPKVQMRRIQDGFALHEAAGIAPGSTRARVTRDGVYTLFFSQK
ncbi:MAG: class I SAM-dependent methyltransferase family protein [Candidatus Saccharimonas sp.]